MVPNRYCYPERGHVDESVLTGLKHALYFLLLVFCLYLPCAFVFDAVLVFLFSIVVVFLLFLLFCVLLVYMFFSR